MKTKARMLRDYPSAYTLSVHSIEQCMRSMVTLKILAQASCGRFLHVFTDSFILDSTDSFLHLKSLTTLHNKSEGCCSEEMGEKRKAFV